MKQMRAASSPASALVAITAVSAAALEQRMQ